MSQFCLISKTLWYENSLNVRICPVNMFICIFELVNVRVCPEIVWISQAEERKHQVTKFLKVRGEKLPKGKGILTQESGFNKH